MLRWTRISATWCSVAVLLAACGGSSDDAPQPAATPDAAAGDHEEIAAAPAGSAYGLERSGTAYRWSANTTATSNAHRSAAARLNDGNTTRGVPLSDPGEDGLVRYQAAGVLWSAAKTLTAVRFVNGALDQYRNGYFQSPVRLQFTTDGSTWQDSGWAISPAYPATESATGKAYEFKGPGAKSGVLGVRITGTSGGDSWNVIISEVQVASPTSSGQPPAPAPAPTPAPAPSPSPSPSPSPAPSPAPTPAPSPSPSPSPSPAPAPAPAPAGTPLATHGNLHVCGTRLCNQNNQEVQLRGMSTHGIQWYGYGATGSGQCLTPASFDVLANDFKADLLRISMYVQEGGYASDPAGFTAKVERIVDEVTQRGMYAVVDFHQLNPGDPNYNLERAKTFFAAISKKYGAQKNILYDIANEPNSENGNVTWAMVKRYHEAIIPVIRANDPDAVILLGTHGWSTFGYSDTGNSQSYMEVVNNPVNAANVMYTFHFYAASHGQGHRNVLSAAADRLPLFVTEFGTQQASGDGGNNFTSSQQWLDLLAQKKISWANWNYSDDERTGAVWKDGTCGRGAFTTANLKEAGSWVRERIRANR